MTNKELKSLFKEIKTERRGGAPHDVWVKRNRDILMMQVRNTTDAAAKRTLGGSMRHFFAVFIPTETFAMAGRAAGIFLLVLGTVAGGGLVSAQVYRDAAPGDTFYKIKMAMESAQLILAPNEEYKTKLHTEFADRRMDEAARLAEADASKQALVPGVLSSFERDLSALQDGLEKLRTEDPAGVAEVAKLMERKMAVYQNMLGKAQASLSSEYAASVAHTRDLIDGVSIKAMAVLVEKHLAGDEHASKAVVATKMEDRLNQAEAKLEVAATKTAAAPKASQAKAAIAEAKKLLVEEDYQAALIKMEEVVELTKEAEVEKQEEEAAAADAATTTPTEEAPAPTGSSDAPASEDAVGSGSR